jgi:hypothetical protein
MNATNVMVKNPLVAADNVQSDGEPTLELDPSLTTCVFTVQRDIRFPT